MVHTPEIEYQAKPARKYSTPNDQYSYPGDNPHEYMEDYERDYERFPDLVAMCETWGALLQGMGLGIVERDADPSDEENEADNAWSRYMDNTGFESKWGQLLRTVPAMGTAIGLIVSVPVTDENPDGIDVQLHNPKHWRPNVNAEGMLDGWWYSNPEAAGDIQHYDDKDVIFLSWAPRNGSLMSYAMHHSGRIVFRLKAELEAVIASTAKNNAIGNFHVKINQFTPSGEEYLSSARDPETGTSELEDAIDYHTDLFSNRVRINAETREPQVANTMTTSGNVEIVPIKPENDIPGMCQARHDLLREELMLAGLPPELMGHSETANRAVSQVNFLTLALRLKGKYLSFTQQLKKLLRALGINDCVFVPKEVVGKDDAMRVQLMDAWLRSYQGGGVDLPEFRDAINRITGTRMDPGKDIERPAPQLPPGGGFGQPGWGEPEPGADDRDTEDEEPEGEMGVSNAVHMARVPKVPPTSADRIKDTFGRDADPELVNEYAVRIDARLRELEKDYIDRARAILEGTVAKGPDAAMAQGATTPEKEALRAVAALEIKDKELQAIIVELLIEQYGYGTYHKIPYSETNPATNWFDANAQILADTIITDRGNEARRIMVDEVRKGSNMDTIAAKIAEKDATYDTRRLIRTESARASADGRLDYMDSHGELAYILPTFDPQYYKCDVCQALVAQYWDGVPPSQLRGILPAHPNCNCTIAAKSGQGDVYRISGQTPTEATA